MHRNIHYKIGYLQETRKTQERFHLKRDKIINLLKLMKAMPRKPTIDRECLPPHNARKNINSLSSARSCSYLSSLPLVSDCLCILPTLPIRQLLNLEVPGLAPPEKPLLM